MDDKIFDKIHTSYNTDGIIYHYARNKSIL